MPTLRELHQLRQTKRRQQWARVRTGLKEVLQHQLPSGTRVWVYGSLCSPDRFHEESDVDLAVEDPTDALRPYALMAAISSATGREADVCRMEETRLADIIQRDGELWIL